MKSEEKLQPDDLIKLSLESLPGSSGPFPSFTIRKGVIPTLQWQLSQYFKGLSLKKEGLEIIESETLENLSSEVKVFKKEIEENNKLLSISNDLLLQLITILNTQTSQAYFWSAPWIASEREAQKDIEEGNIDTFDSSEKIIKFLHE